MTRWKLTLEYNGGPFVGWQWQENGLSVQQVLEEALAKLAGEAVRATTAGRTDAGVHAYGQVAHVDIAKERSPKDMRDGLNFHMRPHPVVVLDAEMVPDDFNARTSARQRQYLYRILNRRAPTALEAGRVWHIQQTLDHESMHKAAQLLIGHHDFTSFRAAECQAKSPMRTLDELTVSRVGDEVHISAKARSFLHHQVRNMVGTLSLVGLGRWQIADVSTALAACDRAKAGPTAPAQALYFMKVIY